MVHVNLETVNRIDNQLGQIDDRDRRTLLVERFNKLLTEISNQISTELMTDPK